MQFDLFDQGSDSQPGGRQMDLEYLIEEKKLNTYELKQEAKRERLLAAAERAEAQSEAAYKRADMREEVSGIPGRGYTTQKRAETGAKLMLRKAGVAA